MARPYDLLNPDCPTRHLIDALGNKWTSILILILHHDGPMRFNELAREADISFKVLTQALRRLERDGFVTRTVEPTRPPAVTYALTPLGASLVPVLAELRAWAERHMGRVIARRAAYDRVA